MPVVPRIDSPPTMPSRALSVFAASASPPGMAISISTSPHARARAATSAIAAAHHLPRHRIDRRLARRHRQPGPRHGADARPGRNVHAAARRARRTVASTSAPWVTSGSSPASLITPAVAAPSSSAVDGQREGEASRRAASVTSTGSGNSPVSSAVKAALAAAVAQAPVVQPRRSGRPCVEFVHAQRNRACRWPVTARACPA